MSKKQALIHLSIAVVIAILFTISVLSKRIVETNEEMILFPNLPVNDIQKITIKSDKIFTEIISGNKEWTVANRDNYPADFNKVRQLLTGLNEVKVIREPQVGSSQMNRLKVTKEKGMEISLFDKDGKVVQSIIFGKRHFSDSADESAVSTNGQVPSGRYVRLNEKSPKVLLLDQHFSNIDADATNWIDKSFVQMGIIKSISVMFREHPNENWELSSNDKKGNMKLQGLAENQKGDLGKIKSLVNFFPSPKIVDIATDKEMLKLVKLNTIVTIEDEDGFLYQYAFGTEIDDTTLVKVRTMLIEPSEKLTPKFEKENKYSQWVYQIPTSLIEAFKFKRSELIKTIEKEQ